MVFNRDYKPYRLVGFSPTRARVYDPLYRALPGLLNQAILARNKDIHLLRMTNGDVEKVRKIIRGQRTKLGGQ